LFGRLRGLNRRQAKARADELIEHFDLVDAADRRASTYSGGMRRRVDLAIALVVLPELHDASSVTWTTGEPSASIWKISVASFV